MKKLIALVALLPVMTWSTIYHVDQASTESIENGSEIYPFKTITQASAIMSAGDTCYIHRGIYRETIVPQQSGTSGSPIRYVAYNHDDVVISGTEVVSNWQVHSNNIYKATGVSMPLGNKNMVFFNSDAQQLARWPNDLDGDPYTFDAYFIETASGTYSDSYITHYDIPDYWTSGVIFYLGAHSGCSVQRTITGFDPGTHQLSFTPMPTGQWPFSNHWPGRYENGHRGIFYLLNRLEALDAPGEWYYDSGASTLYFYAPAGVDPSSGVVEVAVRDKAIDLTKNYVEFDGLNLFGAHVRMQNHHGTLVNIRLRHCITGLIPDINSSGASTAGGAAIEIVGDDNRVERCLIEEGSSNGINVGGNADRTIIRNNVIRNFDKQGNHCCPVRSAGDDALIVSNSISGSARDVSRATGQNSVFSYNEVFDGLKACSDGGLFYVTGNSTVRNVELSYNWFYDAYTPSYAGVKATGIYLDNDTTGYKVHHNVVWDVQWGGLHFNWDAWYNEIYNNTFWNVGSGETVILCWVPDLDGDGGDPRTDVRDNTLINNLSDVRDWWDSGAGSYAEDETLDNIFSNNVQVASDPFVSIADKNFMPATNHASIVDQGWEIIGITDGYIGPSPDVGAYEYGGTHWIPGPDWTPTEFSWLLDGEDPSWITINQYEIIGTNVVLSFTNGPANGWFELHVKTNLMDAMWMTVQTSLPIDGVGAGSVTNPISAPQEFYRLYEGNAPVPPGTSVVYSTSFDSPAFGAGNLDGQNGWVAQGQWQVTGSGSITNSSGAFIRAHNTDVLGTTAIGETMKISSTFTLGAYSTPSTDIADWEEGIYQHGMSHQNGVQSWSAGLSAGIYYDVGSGNVELRASSGSVLSGTSTLVIGAASGLGGSTYTLETAYTKIASDTWSVTVDLIQGGTTNSISYNACGSTADLNTDSDGGGILGGIQALPCSIGAAGVANGPFDATTVTDYAIEVSTP